jgi:hypothetical protein
MSGGSALVVPLLELDEAPAELAALLAAVVLPWPDDEEPVVVAALEVVAAPLLVEVEPEGALEVEPVVPDDAVAPWALPEPPPEVEPPAPVVLVPISRSLTPVMALHAAPRVDARAMAATRTNRCSGKARMGT